MKNLLLVITLVFSSIVSLQAQKTGSSNATMNLVIQPMVPMEGVSSVSITAYTGDLPVSMDTLLYYLGNMDFMKSDVERFAKVKYMSDGEVAITTSGGDRVVNIAFGKPKINSKKIGEAACPIAKEGCTQYYYRVDFDLPAAVQVADASGQHLYGFEVEKNMTLQFGNEQIETHSKNEDGGTTTSISVISYTDKEELELAFSKKGNEQMARKAYLVQIGRIAEMLYPALYSLEEKMKFPIYFGKGKNFDYTETETAAEAAIDALESGNFEALSAQIEVWEAWLKEADLKDKKAKVSPNVAQGLHENLAVAMTFTGDYDGAREHIGDALSLAGSGFVNNNEVDRLKEFEQFIDQWALGQSNNAGLIPDTRATDLKAQLAKNKMIKDFDYILAKDKYFEVLNASKEAAATKASSGSSAGTETEEKSLETQMLESLLSNPSPGESAEAYRGRISNNGLILNSFWDSNLKGKPLPNVVCELTELEELNSRNMGLTGVPDCIASLSNLKKIYLDGNAISNLPESFGELSNLEFIDISDNQLSSLPKSMSNLTSLKTIKIKGNNFSEEEMAAIENMLPSGCKIK